MSWRELIEPVRMDRVAIVAPARRFETVLAAVADAGVVEPERIERAADASPEIAAVAASATRQGRVAALAGWTPATASAALATRLAPLGGTIVRLPLPPGVEPPTLVRAGRPGAAFQPLVDTYATIPYADLNPSLFAGLAYVAMFGMMFGDVGHGTLLLAAGILLLVGRLPGARRYRAAAPFVIGGGLASALFGFLYGEAFGPTGLVPTLWIAPLADPLTLMAAAIAIGAALLAVSYGLGSVNRWREGGFASALVALPGIAGIALYAGLALVGVGWFLHRGAIGAIGTLMTAGGVALSFVGLYTAAGGRLGGAIEAGIELFDGVVRLGANTISFARLAAFGLTHAALEGIVWSATAALWNHGALWWAPATLLFLVGNAVAFALEALVAAIQALRLEYYELFSRIFVAIGRAFAPWHLPAPVRKEST